MPGGNEEHGTADPRHQLEAVGVEEVMGDLHVVLEREAGTKRAGPAAVILEVATENLGGGLGVGSVAERR